jgi:hypothetical protein
LECFERLDILTSEAKETILVVQELERFIPLLDDSLFIRSVRVVNLICAQTLLTLRNSRNLYDRIDEHYESIITAVEASAQNPLSQSDLCEQLKKANQTVKENFESVVAEQQQFNSSIKQELTLTFSRSYEAILNDLPLAGTFEMPRHKFGHSKVPLNDKTQQEIVQAGAIWKTYANGFNNGYRQHLDAIRLMDEVSLTADETVFNVLEDIDSNLAKRLLEARDLCERSRMALASAFKVDYSPPELMQEITRQKDECYNFIRAVTLDRLNHMTESHELNALIKIMLERFSVLGSELPERNCILDEKSLEMIKDFGMTPAAPILKSVPLRDVACSFLESRMWPPKNASAR